MSISTLDIFPQSRKVNILESLFTAEALDNRNHLSIMTVRNTREHVMLNLNIQSSISEDQQITTDVGASLNLILDEISLGGVVNTFFTNTFEVVRK